MDQEQTLALFDRWLALDTEKRISVFSKLYGRMQARLESDNRYRRTVAAEFMQAVELTIVEYETDKEA